MQVADFKDPQLLRANKLLQLSGQSWFVVAVAGQLIFALYVAILYGGSAIDGNLSKWNDILERGYVPGDTFSNVATIAHLLVAVIMMIGGPLQFIPQIRNKAPKFHRWNGRIYVFIAMVAAVSGLMMMWKPGHEPIGGMVAGSSISINAGLILIFSGFFWKTAVNKQFAQHQHWAFRLYLVVNGVWFFRIGLMFWLLVNGGPVGFDPSTFRGPFLLFLDFAQYLLPLAMYEIYTQVRRKGSVRQKGIVAVVLIVCTLVTAVGIFGATIGLWLPEL